MSVPPEAVTAAMGVLNDVLVQMLAHPLTTEQELGKFYLAEAVLEAAAPSIRTAAGKEAAQRGAIAERARIRQLAEQENAHYGCSHPEDYGEPFAGLLGEP